MHACAHVCVKVCHGIVDLHSVSCVCVCVCVCVYVSLCVCLCIFIQTFCLQKKKPKCFSTKQIIFFEFIKCRPGWRTLGLKCVETNYACVRLFAPELIPMCIYSWDAEAKRQALKPSRVAAISILSPSPLRRLLETGSLTCYMYVCVYV